MIRKNDFFFKMYFFDRYLESEHEKIRNIEMNKQHKSCLFEKNWPEYLYMHLDYPYNTD